MPIPRRLKIGPATYPVTSPHTISAGDGARASGHWDYETGELRIARDLNPLHGQQVDTLIHEALHVINDDRAMGLTEEQVHNLANGVAALLIDNPRLTRWIQCRE